MLLSQILYIQSCTVGKYDFTRENTLKASLEDVSITRFKNLFTISRLFRVYIYSCQKYSGNFEYIGRTLEFQQIFFRISRDITRVDGAGDTTKIYQFWKRTTAAN
jgi:hypothetical protein